MQKLNLDKQIIIFSALVLILIGELLVLFPQKISRITVLNKKIVKLRSQLDLVKKEWSAKDSYSQKITSLKLEIENRQKKFIFSQQESKLLSFISRSSKDFNVEILELSPQTAKASLPLKSGGFKYLPINLKAESGFHNLARFLEYLQNSQYFFEIKEINLTAAQPYNLIKMQICAAVKEK